LANTRDANSFAEIYWEAKFMPFIGGAQEGNEALITQGITTSSAAIYRCPADPSKPTSFLNDQGNPDGVANETSYLMNSLLSHKTRRYGRWNLSRFINEVGTSNFISFVERDADGVAANGGEPRQDDFGIWLGT